MVGIPVILGGLLAILYLLYFLKQQWSRRHFPPGPFVFPIIGGLWRIRFGIKGDDKTLIKIGDEYGDIYTLWAGGIPMVFMNGFEAVKDGLTLDELSERLQSPFIKVLSKEKGIGFSNGHVWKQQRRIAQAAMRKLGVGKKSVESQIEAEVEQLIEVFSREKGQPFDPALPVTNLVCNVICALSFGHRFSLEDGNFKELIDAIEYIFKVGGTPFHILYELLPSLMDRLPGPHKKALHATEMVVSLAHEEIQRHKEQQSTHEPQDFIDFYLLEMEKEKMKHDPNSTYDEENLAQSIHDFFIGGTETSATTMKWAFILLANRREVQDKIIKEIEDVLGSASICYEDIRRLPFTNAVLHEIQRYRYSMLMGVGRQTTKDLKIRGYIIPKGTFVMPNLRSALLDPKHWKTPDEFNPNHFLDKDGHFVPRDEFLAFGAGTRSCLGKDLARMELFLVVTSLLREFRFQPPPGIQTLDEEPSMGLTLPPKHYKLCALPRYN
nr:PREDICTED: cytochrome P450 2C31 [Anolis carolinensis]|eukprot:XP_008114470.2 PREDICTED: cytochrome P450 2C31 [Anolis carolinensis]